MKKRVLCLTMGLILAFSQVATVSASTRKQQLQQEKAAAQSQLSAQQSKINSLESKKSELTQEINQLDADLVNVLVEIDILNGELTTKEEEIVQTEADLVVAEQNRDEQYAAMKKRIQYLYERGGNDAWAQMLMQAEDLASLLNQAEYVQQLYDTDRKSLDAFKETVQEVIDLRDRLETEKADLEIMQIEYENRQVDLENQLTEKRATSSNYDAQIASAESQAAQYAELIRQQNAEIRKIEEAEKKAAEEAARKAAEEAARKAAEEEARKQQQSNSNKNNNGTGNSNNSNNSTSNNSSHNNTGSSNTGNSNNNNNNNNSSNTDKNNSGSSSGSKGDSSSNVPYNPKGSSVVGYATQFVGNPYVYGGNSLTNGTDCSGFIQLVYAQFGVSLPRSSGAYLGVGRSVPYSQAMPGDIICYSGHVAIYMGGGAIVHASNSAPYPKGGIKISPNAAYREILSVRRVL